MLCINLVKNWDKYTDMHGQQNVKCTYSFVHVCPVSTVVSSVVCRVWQTSVLRCIYIVYTCASFISIHPWRPGLAGTRAQSCERYGSGTLHLGQVLGGSLPLLSPVFRRSHFSRQVPPSATTRETRTVELWERKMSGSNFTWIPTST